MTGPDAIKLLMDELKIDQNDQVWPLDPTQGIFRILESGQDALKEAIDIKLDDKNPTTLKRPAARIGARVLRLLMALPYG